MEINNIQVCNVCLRSSEENSGAVFIKAMKNGEEIHVCTGCIPHIIHGSGDVAKSNAQVSLELQR
ncbi:hypothetical protein [Sulfurospirillum barnesii]|uniref:Uncharacterized protein n=1 Tax=Sulfurospirillum barnesii (strain ATCC 700032 / DSM 10660 / SES-3) TaxID=760154 RepID=I3XZB5_SULBS|nr:hypothetical protein [Sulfurospirillum barnesii]AFL69289.1 hypothetical protein Sulba_2010 [Sulfurospirillum barnesii SES-3]